MSEKIIQLNEEAVKTELKELVRKSVENTLNELLDKEAEEALIEMYHAGVSVRRVEDISEALWGSRVSASTISVLNQKAYVHIEEWRQRLGAQALYQHEISLQSRLRDRLIGAKFLSPRIREDRNHNVISFYTVLRKSLTVPVFVG